MNFVIAHDGFTLNDLVTYNTKRNQANGEDNRDGSNDNFSWNCGLEGPTDDEAINHLRQRQMRNLMLALLLAQGTPMVLSGPFASFLPCLPALHHFSPSSYAVWSRLLDHHNPPPPIVEHEPLHSSFQLNRHSLGEGGSHPIHIDQLA